TPGGWREAIRSFRESDRPAVAFAREILWVIVVVGGIALLLFVVFGTWPAVVAVESESMLPHMHVNDLVFVVQKDRFGQLQTAESAMGTGYMKFGEYGDVIIYKPNGASNIHPIIHRALAYHDASWYSSNPSFPKYNSTHAGYLTQGDNNLRPDQQSFYPGIGYVEPVKDEWIVGKALFAVPLLGYPTLHYPAFAAVVIILLIIHEFYVSRRESAEEEKPKAKKKRKR
ncbi:MAG TPA: S26 family signal peptidase, partial [Methanomicrobiales archaeon]|nr:S26 family signal peptidase [Methanomicrobiales archaeon]